MSLIRRRGMYTMYARLQVAAADGGQSITDVHRQRSRLRLDPLPLSLIVADLERCDWLSEKQRQ